MKVRILLLFMASVGLFAQSPNDAGVSQDSSFIGFSGRTLSGSDAFDGSENIMSPRFYRGGVQSDICDTYSAGDFQYKTYAIGASGSGEMTVSFDPGSCAATIFVTFHSDSFNPANICENFVFQYGSSNAFTETFVVPVGEPIIMVVSGVQNAPGVVCGDYTWEVSGASQVPTLGTAGMIGFTAFIGFFALAIMIIRKRQI